MSTRSLIKGSGFFPSALDDFFKPWNDWFETVGPVRRMTVPPVNIIENNDQFLVSMAAPGFKKDDFNIDVEGNMITISLEKEESKEEKEDRYTRTEYNYSSFSRSFTLPEDVNQEKIEATYENGVLKLALPKKEEVKKAALSKHIAVR